MPFSVKLAIFWAIVFATIRMLSRYPNSHLARIAFSWHGRIPEQGELKSHFLFRWFLYALMWLAQIAFVFACGYVAGWVHPPLAGTTPFLVFFIFALLLLGGMALLGALIAGISALKAKTLGPNPTFESTDYGRSET